MPPPPPTTRLSTLADRQAFRGGTARHRTRAFRGRPTSGIHPHEVGQLYFVHQGRSA